MTEGGMQKSNVPLSTQSGAFKSEGLVGSGRKEVATEEESTRMKALRNLASSGRTQAKQLASSMQASDYELDLNDEGLTAKSLAVGSEGSGRSFEDYVNDPTLLETAINDAKKSEDVELESYLKGIRSTIKAQQDAIENKQFELTPEAQQQDISQLSGVKRLAALRQQAREEKIGVKSGIEEAEKSKSLFEEEKNKALGRSEELIGKDPLKGTEEDIFSGSIGAAVNDIKKTLGVQAGNDFREYMAPRLEDYKVVKEEVDAAQAEYDAAKKAFEDLPDDLVEGDPALAESRKIIYDADKMLEEKRVLEKEKVQNEAGVQLLNYNVENLRNQIKPAVDEKSALEADDSFMNNIDSTISDTIQTSFDFYDNYPNPDALFEYVTTYGTHQFGYNENLDAKMEAIKNAVPAEFKNVPPMTAEEVAAFHAEYDPKVQELGMGNIALKKALLRPYVANSLIVDNLNNYISTNSPNHSVYKGVIDFNTIPKSGDSNEIFNNLMGAYSSSVSSAKEARINELTPRINEVNANIEKNLEDILTANNTITQNTERLKEIGDPNKILKDLQAQLAYLNSTETTYSNQNAILQKIAGGEDYTRPTKPEE